MRVTNAVISHLKKVGTRCKRAAEQRNSNRVGACYNKWVLENNTTLSHLSIRRRRPELWRTAVANHIKSADSLLSQREIGLSNN